MLCDMLGIEVMKYNLLGNKATPLLPVFCFGMERGWI